FRQERELLSERLLGIDHAAGDRQMLVDHLARHEKVHDLARALEDQIDAAVAHDALDGDRLLTAPAQAGLGLVTAAATYLHRLVDDPPAAHGAEFLAGCGLEPDVVTGPHR